MDSAALIALARNRNVVIATAESCTGGLIAAALTEVPGSSAVLDRGFVTYSNAAKMEMLGVLQTTLDAHGAVSEAVAAEMADGALQRSDATLAISVTGIAGPGGSAHKPEGRVCFGLTHAERKTVTETVEFGALGREVVRRNAVRHAHIMLAQALSND